MPIYSYRCEACGHQQDVLQKMSDPLLVNCPACGAPSLKKQVTAAGFQLKGSGWYVTDFRDQAKTPAKSDDAAKKPESTGDAQPASDAPSSSPTTATPAAPSTEAAAPKAPPPAPAGGSA